jgi:signal transduction histidine kinase
MLFFVVWFCKIFLFLTIILSLSVLFELHEARKNAWQRLIGSHSQFSLEARIFHSISVIALIALAYNIPFNYAIGLPTIAAYSFVTLVIFAFTYYNSRVRGKTNSSIIICGVTVYTLFAINYYFNSGINGPTFLLFSLALNLMLAIALRGQHVFWLVLNLLLVAGLHIAEYSHPEWIKDSYNSRFSRFIDSASAYAVTAVLIFFSMRYIKRNYSIERMSAEVKANSIEEQNHKIVRQNQQLEYVNAEKNKLFSIVAHDLRAPLVSIQNYLELLSEYGLEAEERKRLEQNLLLTTKNTTNMMSNLLSWSRAQMEGVVSRPHVHELSALLRNTLQVESDIAQGKNIDFSYSIPPDIAIFSDADMLQLVVRNLVNNAIKFTKLGGRISIEATASDKFCQIVVSDTGIGIPVESQQDIFTLKAQSTFGTNNEKGVGLGLLLCKEFMDLQGGKIWFESAPGKGTSFYLLIPLANASVLVN